METVARPHRHHLVRWAGAHPEVLVLSADLTSSCEADLFRARPDGDADPFCMVIPPPNVTGNLQIGHVLVYTLHDIVARWRRMQGRDVL